MVGNANVTIFVLSITNKKLSIMTYETLAPEQKQSISNLALIGKIADLMHELQASTGVAPNNAGLIAMLTALVDNKINNK